MTDLQQALGLELPIVQAPMAGVQASALAIAVSSAGGLGSLPCAMLDATAMQRETTALRARTDGAFNLNFFCHRPPERDAAVDRAWKERLRPFYAEFGLDLDTVAEGAGRKPFDAAAAEFVEALRPAVVSFHFGLPEASLLDRVRAAGAKVFSTATSVDEALWLERHGADAVIAQGLEAGGHRGHFLSHDLSLQAGTFALLPQIVAAVRVPVIAAGGIADAAGVAAVRRLGAALVQVGTAYLLCPEATTTALHRQAIGSEAARHTALTRAFTGGAARGIVNRLMRELGDSSSIPPFPLASTMTVPLRAAAEARADSGFSPLWCGQNASGCKAVPAAELTLELAADA